MVTDQLGDVAFAEGIEPVFAGTDATIAALAKAATAPPVPARRVAEPASIWITLLSLAGPLTAAALTFAVQWANGGPVEVAIVVLVALLAAHAFSDREPPDWAPILPLMNHLSQLLVMATSALVVVGLYLVGALPGIDGMYVALIAGCAVVADAVARRIAPRAARTPAVRIAIIGGERVAASLDREMRLAKFSDRYDIVGRIVGIDEEWTEGDEVPVIGRIGSLTEAVMLHNLDLLLMSASAPRLAVFEEVSGSCLQLPVRVSELSGFYERVFCHVAAAEINAAWFQYVLHPRYQAGATRGERALDLAVVALVSLFALPLVAVFALLIRRDGGPVFFRQERVGEGGRPFTMYKLRTMRVGNADTSWATENDHRVTPIGAFLRRTHLDELPQLLNVVRGEMSIVGPRPEQLQIVEELELQMPFYERRHLVKPGVTGWAQVRCGYAGSHVGTAWKLCHDLYYLKHRSVWTNLIIIAETARTLVADRQYTAKPQSVEFILAPAYVLAEPVHAS